VMKVMPTVVFVAYGSAWMIAGAMTRVRWMTVTGILSYIGAVVVGWFAGDVGMYLVFTLVIFAVALVPGLILMRQEPSEIV
jgi:succinate-acetate transporter protein